MTTTLYLGAIPQDDGKTRFTVWAPFRENVVLHLVAPTERLVPLEKGTDGYFSAVVAGVPAGSRYFYRLDSDTEYPDPASRFQPEGLHGPSAVVNQNFPWEDAGWHGLPLKSYIIYELHTGTFTSEGTFDAVAARLYYLLDLGITAVELMPVAQFPGSRNWGYDGVLPYAVQDSYGGPEGLKRLVNACHRKGLAVILDVVYNHVGPEGNHLAEFGPYFTDRYHTPWGAALNFDGAYSDDVRHFFIENALYWFAEYHIDALRLDALHAILDISPYKFIEELAEATKRLGAELGREIHLIGESSANDARLVTSPELGGYGIDAQWNDDFHHALHVLLTGENAGYYQDYSGLDHFVKGFREGFIYSGEYSSYRRHRHGTSSRGIPAERFVVFAQNHDQVGNRAGSERLSWLVSFESLKLAAGLVLLSPFVPLLFMGEEYGETADFPYFISHTDPDLVEAVRKGRRQEFAAFDWTGEIPDPQADATFLKAKIDPDKRHHGDHKALYELHRELIKLRKTVPALAELSKECTEIIQIDNGTAFAVRRWHDDSQVVVCYNLAESETVARFTVPPGEWTLILDSPAKRWNGPGTSLERNIPVNNDLSLKMPPRSFVVIRKES